MTSKDKSTKDSSREAIWIALVVSSIYVSVLRSSYIFLFDADIRFALGIVQLLLLIAAVLLLILTIRAKAKFGLTNAIVAFGLLATISTFWSIDGRETLMQSAALWVMISFIVITATKRWITYEQILEDIESVILLVAPILGFGLLLFAVNVPGAVGDYGRITGLLNNANYAGMISCLVMIFSLDNILEQPEKFRRSGLVFTTAGATALLSGSRGSLLATSISLFLLVILRKSSTRDISKVIALLITSSLLAVAAFISRSAFSSSKIIDNSGFKFGGVDLFSRAPGSDASSGRIELWAEALENWKSRPVLGSGFGTSQELNGALNFTPHNLLLLILVELGILGAAVALFIAYKALILKRFAIFPALTAAVVGVLVLEQFEASFFGIGGPTSTLMWLITFGWISARMKVRESSSKLE